MRKCGVLTAFIKPRSKSNKAIFTIAACCMWQTPGLLHFPNLASSKKSDFALKWGTFFFSVQSEYRGEGRGGGDHRQGSFFANFASMFVTVWCITGGGKELSFFIHEDRNVTAPALKEQRASVAPKDSRWQEPLLPLLLEAVNLQIERGINVKNTSWSQVLFLP